MLACIVPLLITLTAAADTVHEQTPVFTSGSEEYHTFRIPAVVRAQNGDLLAFCEGRRNSASDSGDIDIVLKRSADHGRTWSPLSVVVSDGEDTCGNPAPVVERESGVVLLVFTKNLGAVNEHAILRGTAPPRTVWITRSTDHGQTWSAPEEISAHTRKPEWRWYATGPGHAIQLESGRIVVPANHSLGEDRADWFSHVIFSDDRGQTWQRGGAAEPMTNESTVAELPDGRLYLNMRNYRPNHRRAVAYSTDQGQTWSALHEDPVLVEPVCQASSLSFLPATGTPLLLFSNPASQKRERLTVRISPDGGQSWPRAVLLHEGPSAYSDLVQLDPATAGCLYERGENHAYETIVFATLTLAAE